MMEERGLSLDHRRIYRWVQRYAPELEKRFRPHLRPTNDSYRVDETYVKIKEKGEIAGIVRGEIQMQVKFVSNLFGIDA